MKYIISEDKADGFIRFYHYWRIGHESNFLPKAEFDINIDYSKFKEKI